MGCSFRIIFGLIPEGIKIEYISNCDSFLYSKLKLTNSENFMLTIILLVLSNIFMTFAWYGHLKFAKSTNMFYIILFSWGIAFFEYVLMVPANRIGFTVYKFEGFQLKIIQEVITIFVFILFATLFLGEKIKWNYIVSFGLILLAGYFAFGFGTKSNGH